MEKETSSSSSSPSERERVGSSSSSYRYWVRDVKPQDAAPIPTPNPIILTNNSNTNPTTTLGSLWNQAGTWEEKNLNNWATHRIKELLVSVSSLHFSGGRGVAQIDHVSKCAGDAFLVTVRNKKRVGYTFELTLRVKGEWLVGDEKKKVKGYIDIPEFSLGELNDLEFEVRVDEEKDLPREDKLKIQRDMKLFLQPVREKLLQFEVELKEK